MFEFSMIECSKRAKSTRNELYGRYNPYIEDLSWFAASILHFQAGFCSILPQNSYHRRLGEVKHVEFPMIECSNRARSVKNELYGRFNS